MIMPFSSTLPKRSSAICSAFLLPFLLPLDFVFDFRYLPHIETEIQEYPFEANGMLYVTKYVFSCSFV